MVSRAAPERVAEIQSSLDEICSRVYEASAGVSKMPILVAVSKYKPAEDVLACYEYGHLDFGENYVAELVDKAASLPDEINWHFIGTLQSNKCKTLAGGSEVLGHRTRYSQLTRPAIPNLFAIQTLDSAKKATALDKALPTERTLPLHVFIQVNTSGEASKSGLPPNPTGDNDELVELAQHVVRSCSRLRLRGLMTIGSIEQSTSAGAENKDFATLVGTARRLEGILSVNGREWGVDGKLELSMGMSADFEEAIKAGAGTVRVGTGIFGSRKSKGGDDPKADVQSNNAP